LIADEECAAETDDPRFKVDNVIPNDEAEKDVDEIRQQADVEKPTTAPEE
jgi:hypothetical protein